MLSFDANGDVQQADFAGAGPSTGRVRLDSGITSAAIGEEPAVAADLDRQRLTYWPIDEMSNHRSLRSPHPIDVAVAGSWVVALDAIDRQVELVPANGAAPRLRLLGRPLAVAASGNRAYVITDDGSLVTVDLSAAAASDRFTVCAGAHDVLIDADSLLVACEREHRVERYSLTGDLQETVPVPVSPAVINHAFGGWLVTDALVPQLALYDGDSVSRVILDEIATSAAGVSDHVFVTRRVHDEVDALGESELRSFPIDVQPLP